MAPYVPEPRDRLDVPICREIEGKNWKQALKLIDKRLVKDKSLWNEVCDKSRRDLQNWSRDVRWLQNFDCHVSWDHCYMGYHLVDSLSTNVWTFPELTHVYSASSVISNAATSHTQSG